MFRPSHMTQDRTNDLYAVLIHKSNAMNTASFKRISPALTLLHYLLLTICYLNGIEKVEYVDLCILKDTHHSSLGHKGQLSYRLLHPIVGNLGC